MPQADRVTYLAYQQVYYRRHRGTLRKRARLRQRTARHTKTLWHILDNPQGFCAAMAQRAINEWGGIGRLPEVLSKEDIQQDIAEALVQGRAASRCTNPLAYAATLAIRLARRQIRKAYHAGISTEK